MFESVITRVCNLITDRIAVAVEAGFRRGLENTFGQLADVKQIEEEPEPVAARNGHAKTRK